MRALSLRGHQEGEEQSLRLLLAQGMTNMMMQLRFKQRSFILGYAIIFDGLYYDVLPSRYQLHYQQSE